MPRRRRRRGTWFPILGEQIGTEIGGPTANTVRFSQIVQENDIATIIAPVTFDNPFEGDELSENIDSLADILGSEYVLERIVGKVFAFRTNNNLGLTDGNDLQPAILLGIGFFVARANDTVSGGGETQPIGSASFAERRDNYSCLDTDTVREPWIWRRTWVLGSAFRGTQVAAAVGSGGAGGRFDNNSFPPSTAFYGSVMDGPHIDSRVRRIVHQDNRLWVSISSRPFFGDSAGINALTVSGEIDLRIYGRLRKARQTSAF